MKYLELKSPFTTHFFLAFCANRISLFFQAAQIDDTNSFCCPPFSTKSHYSKL
ncbi:hypothetical protein Fmac_001631 [Flemingia macrophylla]|uniref:Uncharacterized protein n=1 Tax=Flemingia macrophylla TaxID=520843 RepID=A0ABD1NHU4_9FABA